MSEGYEVFMVLEAGFAQTPDEVARKMMQIARLQSGEVLYDLGSGDGTLLILAATEFGARAVGVEIQKKFVAYTREKVRDLGLENQITVINEDFFNVNISDANVLVLYLTPRVLERLKLKLEKELSHGTRIVVYRYPIEGLIPKKVYDIIKEKQKTQIFLYESIGK